MADRRWGIGQARLLASITRARLLEGELPTVLRAGNSGPISHLPSPISVSESYAFGNFSHFAPSLELFTTVSMKAMPSTPSSIVGKSRSLGCFLPSTSALIAR